MCWPMWCSLLFFSCGEIRKRPATRLWGTWWTLIRPRRRGFCRGTGWWRCMGQPVASWVNVAEIIHQNPETPIFPFRSFVGKENPWNLWSRRFWMRRRERGLLGFPRRWDTPPCRWVKRCWRGATKRFFGPVTLFPIWAIKLSIAKNPTFRGPWGSPTLFRSPPKVGSRIICSSSR
jgi:hypothetical protein